MRYIFNALFWFVMIIAVGSLALNTDWGKNISKEFSKRIGGTKAQEASRDSGDRRRQEDDRLKDQTRALQEKLDKQQDDADQAEERLRVMQDRNEAQKARMQAQMDRLRNR